MNFEMISQQSILILVNLVYLVFVSHSLMSTTLNHDSLINLLSQAINQSSLILQLSNAEILWTFSSVHFYLRRTVSTIKAGMLASTKFVELMKSVV